MCLILLNFKLMKITMEEWPCESAFTYAQTSTVTDRRWETPPNLRHSYLKTSLILKSVSLLFSLSITSSSFKFVWDH